MMDTARLDELIEAVTSEEIFAETRKYLETVLNNLHLGVIVLDSDFRITFYNRQQAQLFARMGLGQSVLDLIGADVATHYPLLAPPEWAEARAQAARGASIARSRVPWPVVHPQGHYHVSVLPLQNGPVIGAVCATEDVSPFVKLEDELVREERMALIGQMAIALNHEINNPLQVILGQAETLLTSGTADAATAAALRAVHAAGRRIERVTRKLRLMEEIPLTRYVKDGPMMVDLSGE
ncbi:MAG: histidine kinase dimerization/phospho-acceptor domain-containing protein [Acidobacteriota bacterium]